MTVAQLVYLFLQELPVEGIGMVEVDGLALLVGQPRRVVVIRVEGNDSCAMRWQHIGNLLHYGGLAGTCSACDSYDIHLVTNYFCCLMR